MQLDFRKATASDLPVIVEIYNSTIPTRMATADTEEVSVGSRMSWFQDHQAAERPLLVITNREGIITAWISFQSFYGRPAYRATAELSIYVHEDFRGKGIGKQALHYSLELCPSLCIRTLIGFIFAHNDPSLRLFRKAGFDDWGLLPNVANLDGVERSLIIVGKRVY